MLVTITNKKNNYRVDLSKPIDISIPIQGNASNVNAWYIDHPKIEPHTDGDFVGSIAHGASTNFNGIWFNPHAHGTHTECLGHITEEVYSINQNLKQYFFLAELITVVPEKKDNDFVITKKQLQNALGKAKPEALVIRTLPNDESKKSRQYSNSNPPYLLEEAALFLRHLGVKHLLIDLPSVDKEKDGGKLLAHKAFWNLDGEPRLDATITELVYAPNSVEDGMYLLNLQVAAFENDASPSRPLLFKTHKT